MKSPALPLLLALLSVSFLSHSTTDAVPISHLQTQPSLAIVPPSPQPSTGRTRIRHHSSTSSSTSSPSASSAVYRSHQRARMDRFLASIPKEARLQRSTFFSLSSWHSSHRRTDPHSLATLDGHAVVDEEDDDVGNELLDTEEEGLFRPDDDETIEGEILEEEEDDDIGGEQEAEDTEEEVVGNKSRFTLKIQLAKVHIFKSGWQRENSHDGVIAPEKLDEVRA